jgi:hypothetical protein
MGDTTFFCSAVIYGGFSYFEWISQWQMEVNSTWGQYTLCNFGSCVGGDNQLVGREASDGLNLECESFSFSFSLSLGFFPHYSNTFSLLISHPLSTQMVVNAYQTQWVVGTASQFPPNVLKNKMWGTRAVLGKSWPELRPLTLPVCPQIGTF